jgi:hypothetical protein
MNIMISKTAVQRGFGTDRYKSVGYLSREEKAYLKAGGTVAFKSSALSGGTHGTRWRIVKYWNGRYYPRVPDEGTLKLLSQAEV